MRPHNLNFRCCKKQSENSLALLSLRSVHRPSQFRHTPYSAVRSINSINIRHKIRLRMCVHLLWTHQLRHHANKANLILHTSRNIWRRINLMAFTPKCLLRCYTVSSGKDLPTFRRSAVLHLQDEEVLNKGWDCLTVRDAARSKAFTSRHGVTS